MIENHRYELGEGYVLEITGIERIMSYVGRTFNSGEELLTTINGVVTTNIFDSNTSQNIFTPARAVAKFMSFMKRKMDCVRFEIRVSGDSTACSLQFECEVLYTNDGSIIKGEKNGIRRLK